MPLNLTKSYLKSIKVPICHRGMCTAKPNRGDEKPPAPILKRNVEELNNFFKESPDLAPLLPHVPKTFLETRVYRQPRHFYLISPHIANSIIKHVTTNVSSNIQMFVENNAGLGLITQLLLNGNGSSVRVYESNKDFYEYLSNTFSQFKPKVILHNKDFFAVKNYISLDIGDHGQRISAMLGGLEPRSWTDGSANDINPVLTVIGTCTNRYFVRYLLQSLIMQKGLANYGRFDFFLLTLKKHWQAFSGSLSGPAKRSWNIMFKLFLEVEVLDKYPCKYFLPWVKINKARRAKSYEDYEHLYLIKLSFKKEFPVNVEDFVPLYCFMLHLYERGAKRVIPVCEKWVPDCGEFLLNPTQKHKDYFPNLSIFTKFNQLNVDQVLAIFKELRAHPCYPNSPFADMMESHWLRTELREE